MSAVLPRGGDGAAHIAASLVIALALGLTAHLLGTPLGHDGSLRDLLLLGVDVALIAGLAKRGEFKRERLLRSVPRCWAIALAAVGIAGTLILAEGAPNELWEFVVSAVVLVLTAAVGAFALVLCAEEGARIVVRAIVAIARRLHDGTLCARAAFAVRHAPAHVRKRCDATRTRPRRGPPHFQPA